MNHHAKTTNHSADGKTDQAMENRMEEKFPQILEAVMEEGMKL